MEALLRPVDRVRLSLLHALGPLAGRLAGDLELRVAVYGVLAVAAALAVATTLPLWLLALGPILLGVPHVVADVRYLVVRPGLHRRKLLVVLGFGPLVAVAAGGGLLAGLFAVAGTLIAVETTALRRGLGLALTAAAMALVWRVGWVADVVFAHLHNFLAVALWWAWRPRATKGHRWVLAAFVAASVIILSGVTLPLLEHTGGLWTPAANVAPDEMFAALAPGLPAELATRVVLLFAFAQSIHYAVWLRLVPEEDRGRPTPRTFVATWRALRADLGWPLLAFAVLTALVVAVWAVVDLSAARTGYLRMALFHGHLELVAVTLLLTRSRPAPRARPTVAR